MSISSAQLVWRFSQVISDAAGNGGRMSFVESIDNVKNNGFSDIFESERTAGSTKYRKLFLHVNNDEAEGEDIGLTLVAPRIFVETSTPGEDSINLFLGTQRDIQSALTGNEGLYGMGFLTSSVTGGATSITVTVEDWANLPIFRDGDTIRISDKTSVDAVAGNEEYRTISGAPSVAGNEITLTLNAAIANGYAANAKVASVIEPADIQAAVSNFVNNGSGTFSAAGIATDQRGTVEDDFTLTFSTSTAYTVVGAVTGSLGSGNVGSDFSPTNPDTGSPFLRILSSEFGGTFTANDTITWTTSPSGVGVWFRRDVPAGANSLSNNSLIVAVDGEST